MPHNHEAVAAISLVVGAQANKTLLRNLLEKRLAYVVDSAADAADLVATDPSTGVTILIIICNGRNYLFDSTDTTSIHDGVTVLVTSDGKRYKLASNSDVLVYAVLSRVATPPAVSPQPIGDTYLVTVGTGVFSGHNNTIAVFTSRGWEFITPQIGRLIYVEDEDAYYRKKADGTITIGFGANALAASSVLPSQLLGGGGRENWIIINQTTNAPPAVVNGNAYIIGPSPTGAWASNAGKVAHGEAGVWVIYSPSEGWFAFDLAQHTPFRYNGTTWITAGGNMNSSLTTYTSSGSFSKNSRSAFVEVVVIGGSGGLDTAANGATAGGTSSFGAHCSATGGAIGNGSAGASGTGVGGDFNGVGVTAALLATGPAGYTPSEFGAKSFSSLATAGGQAGGPGGISRKIILASALATSEVVTIGAAGAKGSGAGSLASVGFVAVKEWVLV